MSAFMCYRDIALSSRQPVAMSSSLNIEQIIEQIIGKSLNPTVSAGQYGTLYVL